MLSLECVENSSMHRGRWASGGLRPEEDAGELTIKLLCLIDALAATRRSVNKYRCSVAASSARRRAPSNGARKLSFAPRQRAEHYRYATGAKILSEDLSCGARLEALYAWCPVRRSRGPRVVETWLPKSRVHHLSFAGRRIDSCHLDGCGEIRAMLRERVGHMHLDQLDLGQVCMWSLGECGCISQPLSELHARNTGRR